jgi:hypothetical protein
VDRRPDVLAGHREVIRMSMSEAAPRTSRRRRLRLLAGIVATALVATVALAGTASARSVTARTVLPRGTIERATNHTFADAVKRAHSSEAALHRLASPARRTMPAIGSPSRARAGTAPRIAARAAPRVVSTDPITTVAFDGTAEGDLSVDLEPPDEWVAAGPTAVVESTNGLIQVFSRAGASLGTVPTWAFFGIPAGFLDSDPRIIYDTVHGRWVASILAYLPDESSNLLFFGFSETSDPLGTWDDYVASYAGDLPDFPGLASSSDKIVLTANEFDGANFVGASILAVSWASLLGGGLDGAISDVDPGLFSIRPARIVGSSPDVHLIAEGTADGHVMYERFSGPASSVSTAGFIDITTTGPSLAAFTDDNAIVAPRQTGADTIENAVDGRPTDAVWRNNQLWFISTATTNPGGGDVDAVRVTRIVTGSGTPTAGADSLIATDGIDSYMGGIGVSGNGTPFVTWTTSSPTDDPAAHYASFGGDTPGTVEDFRASDGPYAGERWGDYAGVAFDPLAAGAAWIVGETSAGDGTWRTSIVRAVLDSDAPSAPGTPLASIVFPATLSDFVPVRITWGASSDATSGIARYQVLTNEIPPGLPATGFGSPATTTGTTTTRSLVPSHGYAFRVSAVDGVGNVGPATTGSTFTPTVYATPVLALTGTWHKSSSLAFIGQSARWSSTKNSTATFSFTGRAFAFVTFKGPTRGSVKVYVDNVFRGTLSLYSVTSKQFQLVFGRSWTTSGAHKVKFVVLATIHRPRVDIDGFIVLK